MIDLIERIKQQAALLKHEEDSLVLDKALGELDCLIHEARMEIDIEWREARAVSREFKVDAKQLIADLFKEGEDANTES